MTKTGAFAILYTDTRAAEDQQDQFYGWFNTEEEAVRRFKEAFADEDAVRDARVAVVSHEVR